MQRVIERMLKAHPGPPFAPPDLLSECIRACAEGAQVATTCADACLAEAHPDQLVRCIRLCLDCADICTATVRVLSRQAEPDMGLVSMQLELCAAACMACSLECGRCAPYHMHCQICAATCHRCHDACRAVLSTAAEHARLPH